MADKDVLEKRLLRLEHVLRKLKVLSEVPLEKYLKDEGIQDRAERNLQIAARVCIDIGQADQKLFEVLVRGEFNIRGFQNKMIRKFIPELSPRLLRSGQAASVSRILKRLSLHGLIKRVARSRKYYLTKLGKAVITTGLKTRALFIIPSLAGLELTGA